MRSVCITFRISCWGEQQPVAIAQAFAKDAPVILADEPTGELDFGTGVWSTARRPGACRRTDVDVIISVALATIVWAVLIGVIVVALTPVLMTQLLTKMDIPSTLRVVE